MQAFSFILNKYNGYPMLHLNISRIVMVTFGFICISSSGFSQQATHEWNLIFEDRFETDGAPDAGKWSFAGRGSADWKCYCTDSPETTFVEGGVLHLKALPNTQLSDTVRYQTGCIQTKDNFSFKYGKVEVKAKLSRGKGSWPAIWLMPQESKYGGWPKSGEIDMMEHLNFDTIVYQTLHSHHITELGQKDNPPYSITHGFDVDEFNIYGLEWYEDRLEFFVNGTKTFIYPKLENADDQQWPFDQEFYLILNQALGGAWVGEIHEEDLPVQMMVDWVRVYQTTVK